MSGFWRFFRYGLLTIAALVAILITMPFIWLASGFIYQSVFRYTHHYRLVLEIEDHGEIRKGSSVIGVSISPIPPWNPKLLDSPRVSVRGEAVVVELSTGQVVVATLRHGPTGNGNLLVTLASRALGKPPSQGYKDAPNWDGSAELTGSLLPLIVTFDDINDPYSLRAVPPEEFVRRFGPRIQFRRMLLEMTSDPVTREIERKLPFLETRRDELASLYGRPILIPNLSKFIRGQ